MVLDLGLPDMRGFELLETIRGDEQLADLPIIVYTGTRADRAGGDSSSSGFTDVDHHQERASRWSTCSTRPRCSCTASRRTCPSRKRRMLTQLHQADPVLAGKQVLIVDDDVRNIFALTSVLERHKMEVLYAENGRKGIEVLQEDRRASRACSWTS